MKRLFKLVLIAALIGCFAAPALAVDQIFCKSMTGTTAGAAYTGEATYGAYVIIPGDNNAQVVVASFSATADSAASYSNADIYDKENEATVNSGSAAGGQTLYFASGGASFDASDVIVLQDTSGSTVYIESVSSAAATNIVIHGTLDGAVAAGWKVYEMEQIATIPVGAATASFESDVAVVAATKDSPLLIIIHGYAACSINFASGHYK